jgi:hypothetical protein
MLAQATTGHKPKPVTHPALFALRQSATQYRRFEDNHPMKRSDVNHRRSQKVDRQKGMKPDGKNRNRTSSAKAG